MGNMGAHFYVLLTVHLGIILVNNQLDTHFFFLYIYFDSLHVSSNPVLIIRRINCIDMTSGICHCVGASLVRRSLTCILDNIYLSEAKAQAMWFSLMTNLTHNSFLCMFISVLYTFQACKCSSSGDSIVPIRYLVYFSLCRWPYSMQVPDLHTIRSPKQSNIYQMSYWQNWFSLWWALACLKHVENWNKHTQKRFVGQVGH